MKKIAVEPDFLDLIKNERERFEKKLITQRLTKAMDSASRDFLAVFKKMESRFELDNKKEYFCLDCDIEIKENDCREKGHLLIEVE